MKRSQEIDPARYVLDESVSQGFNEIWNLDGVDWYYAPNPPARHDCWAQTKGLVRFKWVFRCACGAIALDDTSYWMQKNANMDPHHTIYSEDYYPPKAPPKPRLLDRILRRAS